MGNHDSYSDTWIRLPVSLNFKLETLNFRTRSDAHSVYSVS
jgi:hypothetical protein